MFADSCGLSTLLCVPQGLPVSSLYLKLVQLGLLGGAVIHADESKTPLRP